MKNFIRLQMQGLKELWADIDRHPFCGPPGCEKGGRLTFIVWFGVLFILFGILISGFHP